MSFNRVMEKTIECIPGDCLIKSDESITALNGTYCRNGYYFASIAGFVRFVEHNDNNKTIEVIGVNKKKSLVPEIGSVVTCRVLSINANCVHLNIHCIEDQVLKQPFRAVLRRQDIKDSQQDKIEVWKCFRPADIILAKVIGWGENRMCLVTTAHNELGVVVALNQSALPMRPISWSQMSCETTFATEPRKVAQLAHLQHLQHTQHQ